MTAPWGLEGRQALTAMPPLEVVVVRRIDQPDVTGLPAGMTVPLVDGRLRIDRPFAPAGSGATRTWQTTGRLYRRGPRVVLFARVNLELQPWGNHTGELNVRPAARHVALWGKRRQRRYFALAHQSADRLHRLFSVGPANVTACSTPATTSKSSSAYPETTSLVPSV